MTRFPILAIIKPLDEHESIVDHQIYQFYPETGTQYNKPGNVTMTVNDNDAFFIQETHGWNLRVRLWKKRQNQHTRKIE